METVPSEMFLACRDALTGDRPHRVWSLIITIFGDLAQAPGSRIGGAVLGQITELVGIKPEAMRVALHRLRKDGWVESQRDGRASVHFLTDFGRHQSAEASPRIYGPDLPRDTPLHVLVADDSTTETRRLLESYALTAAYVHLGGNVLVGLGSPPEDAEGLCVIETTQIDVPDWVRQRVCPPDLAQDYAKLLAAFEVVNAHVAQANTRTPLETAALRTLVVHSWRRLLLRHANLPPQFFPVDWRGPECRQLVRKVLSALPVEDLDLLSGNRV